MNLAIVGGLFVGLGAWMLVRFLVSSRSRPSLVTVLARFEDGEPAVASHPEGSLVGALHRVRTGVLELVQRSAVGRHFGPDLAITEQTWDQVVVEGGKMTVLLGGIPLVALVLKESVRFPLPVPAIGLAGLAVAMAALGAASPFFGLKAAATERRKHFRRALGVVLDLASLAMAGGTGVEGSFHAATRLSSDWAVQAIRQALQTVRLQGQPLYVAFETLGQRYQVADCSELASGIALSEAAGARLRDTIAAKAASLRDREIAELEDRATATTERLFVPATVMFMGFMIILLYPPLYRVLHSL